MQKPISIKNKLPKFVNLIIEAVIPTCLLIIKSMSSKSNCRRVIDQNREIHIGSHLSLDRPNKFISIGDCSDEFFIRNLRVTSVGYFEEWYPVWSLTHLSYYDFWNKVFCRHMVWFIVHMIYFQWNGMFLIFWTAFGQRLSPNRAIYFVLFISLPLLSNRWRNYF